MVSLHYGLGPGAPLLSLVSLPLLLNPAAAVTVNRTIDDTFGDSESHQVPVFLPTTAGVWGDQTCFNCLFRPETDQAFRSTYSAATFTPGLGSVNVTMDFNGTAIYVFLITSNKVGDGINSTTNAIFKLDGQQVGTFVRSPSPDLGTMDFQFNVLAFCKEDIPFGQHRLVVASERIKFDAYLNFDYAIYTTHDDNPNALISSRSAPLDPSDRAGAIAGGIIGGLASLITIIILLWFYIHRRRESRSKQDVLPLSMDNLPGSRRRNSSFFTSESQGPYPSQPTTRRGTVGLRPAAPEPSTSKPIIPLRVINPDPGIQARVRSVRQAELLTQQIVDMRGEIEELKGHLGSGQSRKPTWESFDTVSDIYGPERSTTRKVNRRAATVAELKEEIEELMERVTYLQSQQFGPRAIGLTNESPPDYTPTPTSPSFSDPARYQILNRPPDCHTA